MLFLTAEILDSFRARVTPEDLAGEQVRRVNVVGEADFLAPVAKRFFPDAEIVTGPADAVVIAMTGGPTGPRLRALLSRARHKLLVPSPDYVYRFQGSWLRAALELLALPVSFVTMLILSTSALRLARRLK
jgi:hypothetical protein